MTDERKALVGAYFEAHGQTPGYHSVYGEGEDKDRGFRFAQLLDCGAYLSAAEMLLPEGLVWNVMTDFDLPGRARLWGSVLPGQVPDRGWQADGDTPALALLGAIREARKNDAG